ncbi:MAG TPA: hypothetical protein EYP62_04925 [Kiritimatiellae bacterium]|nr:hypothetical protein [Kiritimatiellia bacterium]
MASFNAACRAYEKGDYEHALQMNMRIIQNGFISAALLYNIGNCYFRVGDLPRAILYYRRAWYLAPSDVDITANLTFALRALGLEPLRSNRAFGLLRYLSLPHWAMVLVAAYWIICFLLSAMLWNPRLRRIGRKLVLAVALLALLASLGLGSRLPLLLDPEAVVAAPNTKVLFAPVAGSTLHFYLPQGSFVRIRRARDGWLEVEEGPGRRGWVPEASLRRIIPRRTHQWKR